MTHATATIEPVVSVIRIRIAGGIAGPYDQSCVLQYRTEELGTAWITLMTAHRPHTLGTLRALKQALIDAGLRAVYGKRDEGHCIPGAVDLGNGIWRYDLVSSHPQQPT